MEILKKYISEIGSELNIDEMNLKESSMRAPARKHFWVSRLITHKLELNEAKKLKEKTIKALMSKVENDSPIAMSKINLEKSIENTDEIKTLNHQIKEHEMIVEYLEKVEKIYSM